MTAYEEFERWTVRNCPGFNAAEQLLIYQCCRPDEYLAMHVALLDIARTWRDTHEKAKKEKPDE